MADSHEPAAQFSTGFIAFAYGLVLAIRWTWDETVTGRFAMTAGIVTIGILTGLNVLARCGQRAAPAADGQAEGMRRHPDSSRGSRPLQLENKS